MPTSAEELARRLVEYDRAVAETVLEMLRERLGDRDAVASEVGDPQTTTAQWKDAFREYEAARALASALAPLLGR